MTPDIRHYGVIKNRKLVLHEPELYNKVVESLEGKEFCLTIKKRHKPISPNKHAYYRGGILGVLYQTEMFHHLDNKDQIHDLYFAPKFLPYVKPVVINGKTKEMVGIRSLADLSDSEMGEFIERVIADCEMELGTAIMSPETYYSKYYNKT
jgi:hypothetical protein